MKHLINSKSGLSYLGFVVAVATILIAFAIALHCMVQGG